MDIQAYKDSGILELYVLGKLSAEESAAVSQEIARYPALQEEVEAIEISLEALALSQAVPPPPAVLSATLDKIRSAAAPTTPVPKPHTTGGSLLQSIAWPVALLGLAASAFFAYQSNDRQADLAALQSEYQTLLQACDEQRTQQQVLAQQLDIFRNPAFSPVVLSGTELAPDAIATVLFNPKDKRVYINTALPAPPTGKQYQLWALVDGKPIDMGVLALDIRPDTLTEVPFVEGAAAFAITLEDAGGHPTPNLEQLYVIGNV